MTKERPIPYVGISGVSEAGPNKPNTIDSQFWLADQFIYTGLDSDYNNPDIRRLALGVKATHKTQYLDQENKYGHEWYPVGDEFVDALDRPWDMCTAQIYFDPEYVHDAEYRDEFVARICRRGQKWLNALQFDLLPWHEDDTMLPFLEKVKSQTKHTIILQAHGEAMDRLGKEGVVRKLGKYAHALDYVLFDASHGKGVRMDTDALLPYLDAAYKSTELEGVGFGVAGGLCAEVVAEELPKLLKKHRNLSVDAEGQLHGTYADGSYGLDWDKSRDYMQAVHDVLYALRHGNV